MKQKNIFLIFLLGLTLLLPVSSAKAWASGDRAEFQKANRNYREGHFKEAVDGYKKLSEKYPRTAVFFFNLGNAYHRTNVLGPAILSYERALRFDPRNSDIRYNLNYAKGLSQYRVEDKRNWYLRISEGLLGYVTQRETFILVLFFYLLLAGSWAFVLFFRPGTPWGTLRKSFLMLTVLSAIFWGFKNFQPFLMKDAIVMTEGSQVRYGPSDTDQTAFRLGEGLKVYVVDSREGWSRVLIPNGDSGWIDNSEISLVNP